MSGAEISYVVLEDFGGRPFPLSKQLITVGRSVQNDLQLQHDDLSRHHAQFILQGSRVFLQDLNSTNGTFVNSARVTGTVELRDGDTIHLAYLRLTFRSGNAMPAASPASTQPATGIPSPFGAGSLAEGEPSTQEFQQSGDAMHFPPAGGRPPGPVMEPPPGTGQAVPPRPQPPAGMQGPPPGPVAGYGSAAPAGAPRRGEPPPAAALEGGDQPVLLTKDVTAIGRAPGNDVMIPDGAVSSRHATIEHRNGEFVLTDIGSSNGTLVNGRRIAAPWILQPGDEIQFGDTTFFFRRLTPTQRKGLNPFKPQGRPTRPGPS